MESVGRAMAGHKRYCFKMLSGEFERKLLALCHLVLLLETPTGKANLVVLPSLWSIQLRRNQAAAFCQIIDHSWETMETIINIRRGEMMPGTLQLFRALYRLLKGSLRLFEPCPS